MRLHSCPVIPPHLLYLSLALTREPGDLSGSPIHIPIPSHSMKLENLTSIDPPSLQCYLTPRKLRPTQQAPAHHNSHEYSFRFDQLVTSTSRITADRLDAQESMVPQPTSVDMYSMIVWNCNKVNSYISALKHLPRLSNRAKQP